MGLSALPDAWRAKLRRRRARAVEVHRTPLLRAALILLTAAWGLWVNSCSSSPVARPRDWVLDDGRTLGQLLGDSGTAVVLIMDPGDWFRCFSVLAEWLEWRRGGEGQFHLVFSRQPTALERRLLIVARLRPEPFVTTGTPSREHTPMELVFHDGRLVYADSSVRGATSRLLQRLRSQPLREIFASVDASGSMGSQPVPSEGGKP